MRAAAAAVAEDGLGSQGAPRMVCGGKEMEGKP